MLRCLSKNQQSTAIADQQSQVVAKQQSKKAGGRKFSVILLGGIILLVGLAAIARTSMPNRNAEILPPEPWAPPKMSFAEKQAELARFRQIRADSCKTSLIETLSGERAGLLTAYCGGRKDYDPLKGRVFDFDKHVASISAKLQSDSCDIYLTEEGEAFFSKTGDPKDFKFNAIPVDGQGGYFKVYLNSFYAYQLIFERNANSDVPA